MPKFATCEAAVGDLAERQSLQGPKEGDYDALLMGQETLAPGTSVTITLPVEKGWTVHIKRMLVDFAPFTNYRFIARGVVYEGDNEAEFSVPQKETNEASIVIENASAVAVTYAWKVVAWSTVRD